MRDFTINTYRSLLKAFLQAGYRFQTFQEFMEAPLSGKVIVLRHDVDELAWNALKMAKVENEFGIRATYFFRVVKQSNVPEVIRNVVALGHELGYHYEDLAASGGDMNEAVASFQKHLEYFRQYYPVKSVCMHGSSTSKFDNRELWKEHRLSDFGLTGEPYLTVNFDTVFYLSDTGYAWDGGRYAVRDVVKNSFGLSFHNTRQIVDCVSRGLYPEKSLVLAHTLWSDNLFHWSWLHFREFLRNRVKLLAKNHKTVAKWYDKIVKSYWKNV